MIDAENVIKKIRGKNNLPQETIHDLKNLLSSIVDERDRLLDLCIKKSQELSMEQDGFMLGYTKTKECVMAEFSKGE
jgi:hypothetical protein